MGMYGTLRRASAAEVERLRANPALVEPFLYGAQAEVIAERPPGLLGFLLRFTPITISRAAAQQPSAAPHESVSLDKAWHGLHFLFTGTADSDEEPACFVISGGEDIGEDQGGDPVARLLEPAQVRDFAAFLAALTPDELRRRFDPERMTALEIYPEIWDRPLEEDDTFGFLLESFALLRESVTAAAAAGESVLITVS